MEIDLDNGDVILYPAEEGGEEVVVDYQDRRALKYLKRKIRDARSFENGILFAASARGTGTGMRCMFPKIRMSNGWAG